MSTIKILSAPLQGYTDAAWRSAHREIYGDGVVQYFTPFVRMEGGVPRPRDLRDAPAGEPLTTPQIIFGSASEMRMLVDALIGAGHTRIDLNCGCPHPPQMHKGRGAAMLLRPEVLREAAYIIDEYPAVTFSLKMRTGVTDGTEWRQAMPEIARMRLSHVTVHARTARQQYRGEVDTAAFEAIAAALPCPAIFNGDVTAPQELPAGAAAVMIGRGLLGRPSLAAEWCGGEEWPRERRIDALMRLHARVLDTRGARLCGPAQLLAAMQPFWHFCEDEIGHRNAKAIRKARTLEAYEKAV
ncbi:MAG: tRNA-dihydrouridine synthase family protein, partial [Muribaculaceae bacterium]|nr:tRNA-dihydrouridine synthase family protein [Muribaculaceae bacterium]